jgi:MYXO-CTERM domain-containing protein
MKPRLLTSIALGASVLGGVALAETPAVIATFPVHNDLKAGALWKNDRSSNNNPLGAGAEHTKMTVLKGGRILVVATASYTDITPLIPGAGFSSLQAKLEDPADGDPGVQPQGERVQALCAAYQLDAQQGLVKVNVAYFTDNESPDWQNGNKPSISPINGGTAALAMFGMDPNGNRTRIYGRVLGPNCELLSQQTQLFADNNDDYGGIYDQNSKDVVVSDSGGETRTCLGWIGNGNGTDDARFGCVTTKATGQTGLGSYTIAPDFKISIEPQEQRSRGQLQKTTIPNTLLFAVAEGNDAPPDHIRVGLVNTAKETPNDQRVIFRQRVATRKGNIHFSTPSIVPITDPATGAVTNRYILSYVKVDTTNREGRTKGRTVIQTVPLELSPTGVKLLDTPRENLFGLSDNSHPGMSAAVYGIDQRPVAFMFASNVTDGGTANVKVIGLTPEGKLDPIRALNWGDASAGGWISQHYGPNAQTPQGRTYPPTTELVDNPGYGTGYQPDVKKFLVVANVHHMSHPDCVANPNKGTNNGNCGGKNALSLVLVPVVADAPKGNPTNPDDPTPIDPTQPQPADPGTTLSGCAAAGGEGAGAMLLLGLAAFGLRRRRSN